MNDYILIKVLKKMYCKFVQFLGIITNSYWKNQWSVDDFPSLLSGSKIAFNKGI